MTLATNKSDSTIAANDHAAHHNAIATAVNRIDGRVIDAADATYGLDLTGTNDCSAGLAAAVAATPSGGTLLLPAGTMLINSNIAVNKQINVLGMGIGSTHFKLGGNINGWSFNVGQASSISHIKVGGFSISTATTRSSGAALQVGRVSQSWFDDIWITDAWGGSPYRGIEILSGAQQCYWNHIRVADCAFDGIRIYQDGSQATIIDHWFGDEFSVENNGNHALIINNAAGTGTTNDIEGIYVGAGTFAGSTLAGIRIDLSASSTVKNLFFRGTIIDGNDNGGLTTTVGAGGSIQVIRIEDIWVSHNTGASGIVLGGGVDDFVIDGGHFSLQDKSAIQLFGARHGHIRNATMMSNNRLNAGDYGVLMQSTTDDVTVSNCRVYNNTTVYGGAYSNGIFVDTTCTNIQVYDNYIATGGGTTPYSDSSSIASAWGNITDATLKTFVARGDIDAAGGYRQTIDGWYFENVTGTVTDQAMTRLATTTDNPNAWIAPRAGSVTAIAVHSNAARSGGTLTAKVFKNGSALGSLTAVLDGTNTTNKATTQAKDTSTFVAGDLLDIRFTTSSWTPTTADIRACLEVET